MLFIIKRLIKCYLGSLSWNVSYHQGVDKVLSMLYNINNFRSSSYKLAVKDN